MAIRALFRLKLWQQIFIAMILGVVVGLLLGDKASVLKPLGTAFINLIKMLIIPLIFTTLVVGITSMEDTAKLGRIGAKTFLIYLLTTAVAITIGLLVGTLLQPGVGIDLPLGKVVAQEVQKTSFAETLVSIVTKNPIKALAEGRILQIIFFAIFLGIALNITGEKAQPVKNFFNSFAEVMYTLTELVLRFAPLGIFALMAWVAGTYGLALLLPLMKVIFAVYLACFLHLILVVTGGIRLFARLNPFVFFRGIIDPAAFAFVSTSSSGTLPVSISAARKNLGVSSRIAGFVLPLGATINMDGTAIYQGVAVLFIAQAYGIDLSMVQYGMIIMTATLASIGTAGVPGAGLIMLTLVLSTVGLPLEGIALIAGIDRILDMARTSVNVVGDLMVSVLVARSEDEFDAEIFQESSQL